MKSSDPGKTFLQKLLLEARFLFETIGRFAKRKLGKSLKHLLHREATPKPASHHLLPRLTLLSKIFATEGFSYSHKPKKSIHWGLRRLFRYAFLDKRTYKKLLFPDSIFLEI